MSAELSWIVTIVGLWGFWMAGNKVWWAWYINIGNQLLWVAFAIVSGYYAFLLGTAFYLAVFIKNAYQWTVEHQDDKLAKSLFVPASQAFDRPEMNLDGPPASSAGDPLNRTLVGEQREYIYDDLGVLIGERSHYVFEDEIEVDTSYLEKETT